MAHWPSMRLRGASLCIAVIDIDHFKVISDTHRHDAGDTVLRHFADICRGRVRAQDVLGRMGGEEFLLVLPGAGSSDASRVIGRIREGFALARLVEDEIDLPYTFSGGVAEARPGDDRSSILRRADRALYTAKGEGETAPGLASRRSDSCVGEADDCLRRSSRVRLTLNTLSKQSCHARNSGNGSGAVRLAARPVRRCPRFVPPRNEQGAD
jgi:diguanylate cyclase (GGDEF)-like protein